MGTSTHRRLRGSARPRPGHPPHHPGDARTRRPAVPARQQVWLIERYVTDLAGTPLSAVAALGVTNLPADTATPQRLAPLVRNHWGIESLHWLRDTVYREDNSTVRTRSGPRVMAGLRNLAVGAHHLAGRRDITEASREAGRAMHRPFKILKLARS
jgi:Transposase DDE domain